MNKLSLNLYLSVSRYFTETVLYHKNLTLVQEDLRNTSQMCVDFKRLVDQWEFQHLDDSRNIVHLFLFLHLQN